MPRITLCAYDRAGACGGPYGWMPDLAVFLHAGGSPVEVLILCPGGQANSGIAAKCHQAGISVAVLDTDAAVFLEDQTEWILRQWACRPSTVFVANIVLPALYASRWIRQAGGRAVAVMHSNPCHCSFCAEALRRFVSGPPEWRLDAVVAVSKYIGEKVKENLPAHVRLEVIPCGTRLSAASAIPLSDTLRLLYCGRLVQEAKRVRELADSFLEAAARPGVAATLCGDGEERAWLERRLAGQDRVRYIGALPLGEVQEVMLQHHAIVLLSDYEGLPMSVVEGMACGLVPVCLDEPSGAREIIRHGVNGFLVKDRGPAFLAAVDQLRNPDLWRHLSAEARKTVESRYAHPVVFAKWSSLIRDLGKDAPLRLGLLPRRVNLRSARPKGVFSGYPCCRPSRWEKSQERLNAAWLGLRMALRPRNRLRALLKPRRHE